MDTDAKIKAQYYTLRGNEGTAAERKGWIGKSYEEFNSVARPEVDSRETHRRNLESAVSVLTKERDEARAQVAKLTGEVLAERDRVRVLQAENATLTSEIEGAKEAYKQLEAQHQAKIDELVKVIEIKDNEIKRLSDELTKCQASSGDCADMSGWEMIKQGIIKLLKGDK